MFNLQLRYSQSELQYLSNGYFYDYRALKKNYLKLFNQQIIAKFTKPNNRIHTIQTNFNLTKKTKKKKKVQIISIYHVRRNPSQI